MRRFTFLFYYVSILIFGSICISSGPTVSAAEQIRLDQLQIDRTSCGWQTARANLAVGGAPLKIAGTSYSNGVGTHALASICVKLSGQKAKFRALIGIDDEGGKPGTVQITAFGDEKILWKSEIIRGLEPARPIELDLDGIRKLMIIILPVDQYYNDHVDFVNARFDYSGDKPEIIPSDPVLLNKEGLPVNRYDEHEVEWYFLEKQIEKGTDPEAASQALHPASTIFKASTVRPLPQGVRADRDPLDIVLRRIEPLIEHLSQLDPDLDLTAERSDLAKLKQKADAVDLKDQSVRQKIFIEAVALRKRTAFKNPLLDFKDLLFIKRHNCLSAETKGNHMCDQYFGFNALPGGGLFVLKNAFSDHPEAVDLLTDQKVEAGRVKGKELDRNWAFLAPELSADTREIVFAAVNTESTRHNFTWTKDNCYHIFKSKFDPNDLRISALRQITDGAFNDFDPCPLPNGRIAFISERRGGYGRCHPRIVPTYTLHSMNADGSDIIPLSWHETNEFAPVVDPNGMIVYTRWDYVDRGANNAHHPWITAPDGHDPRALQGNYHEQKARTPIMEMDLRPVPNSRKMTATAAGHHGETYGSLLLIDPQVPDDYLMSTVRRITPNQLFPESELSLNFEEPAQYATCYPLSEYFYLCVFDPFGRKGHGTENRYGIYLLDAFGNHVLLYRDRFISCRDAMPIRVRDLEPIVPQRALTGRPLPAGETFKPIDPDKIPKTAKVGVVNVYDSTEPMPKGVKIERLRIVQVLPKTTPYGDVPRIGYGDQKNARRILGTVPVEEDGSAYFELPVNIPVYFQALDKEGRAVQSMRSDTYVHPGADLTCQGCHEQRLTATPPRPGYPQAMRRTPSKIERDPDGTFPVNFVRLIQPVLDAKCVECHAKSNDPKAIDLSDNPKDAHFSNAFNNLKKFCFYYNHYLWDEPRTVPNKFGAARSPLYQLLKSDHYGVKLTDGEMYRFLIWMDNNCDFYGSYDDIAAQRAGESVAPKLE